jgi:hypothetical protein
MESEKGNASITFTKFQAFECPLELSLLLILFRRLPPIEVVVVKFPFVIETRALMCLISQFIQFFT